MARRDALWPAGTPVPARQGNHTARPDCTILGQGNLGRFLGWVTIKNGRNPSQSGARADFDQGRMNSGL
jgi:hypothetical protein